MCFIFQIRREFFPSIVDIGIEFDQIEMQERVTRGDGVKESVGRSIFNPAQRETGGKHKNEVESDGE